MSLALCSLWHLSINILMTVPTATLVFSTIYVIGILQFWVRPSKCLLFLGYCPWFEFGTFSPLTLTIVSLSWPQTCFRLFHNIILISILTATYYSMYSENCSIWRFMINFGMAWILQIGLRHNMQVEVCSLVWHLYLSLVFNIICRLRSILGYGYLHFRSILGITGRLRGILVYRICTSV